MKKTFIFLTDSIIFGVFIGLIVVAFIITYALSPISVENNNKNTGERYTQVSGDIPADTQSFEFRNLFSPTTNEHIVVEQDANFYTATISFDKLLEQTKLDLLQIINPEITNQGVKISLVSPLADTKDIEMTILGNGEELVKGEGELKYGMYIKTDSAVIISLRLDPKYEINYPFEVVLEVKRDNNI